MEPQELHELFRYDPDTGKLYWRHSYRGPIRAGDEAGTINADGYRVVKIRQKRFMAHHIVFAMHNGRWPYPEVDHRNHNTDDNRIQNLREATRLQNCRNLRAKGYRFETARNRWLVRIVINGRQTNLGRYKTEAEAKAVYDAAKRIHYREYEDAAVNS
jgi:hypothetical protein